MPFWETDRYLCSTTVCGLILVPALLAKFGFLSLQRRKSNVGVRLQIYKAARRSCICIQILQATWLSHSGRRLEAIHSLAAAPNASYFQVDAASSKSQSRKADSFGKLEHSALYTT